MLRRASEVLTGLMVYGLLLLAGLFVLSGCTSLTAEERQEIAEQATQVLSDRIDVIRGLIGDPEVSDSVLVVADVSCLAFEIGSPYLVAALNRQLLKRNEGLPPENLVTVEEFTAELQGVCTIVHDLLAPADA